MTITVMSDTHQLHRELNPLPGGDLLLHAGDFTMFSRSCAAIQDFARWFGEQPYRFKVLTMGNHEFAFEADAMQVARMKQQGIFVLINEVVELEGLKIWGSPVTPLYSGAYGLSSPEDRTRHWAGVPDNVDVLLTHGPPLGFLDKVPGQLTHQGDPELLGAVRRVRPRLHVFGHIHDAFGLAEAMGTTFLNAAVLGADGGIKHQPVTLRLPRVGGEIPAP